MNEGQGAELNTNSGIKQTNKQRRLVGFVIAGLREGNSEIQIEMRHKQASEHDRQRKTRHKHADLPEYFFARNRLQKRGKFRSGCPLFAMWGFTEGTKNLIDRNGLANSHKKQQSHLRGINPSLRRNSRLTWSGNPSCSSGLKSVSLNLKRTWLVKKSRLTQTQLVPTYSQKGHWKHSPAPAARNFPPIMPWHHLLAQVAIQHLSDSLLDSGFFFLLENNTKFSFFQGGNRPPAGLSVV